MPRLLQRRSECPAAESKYSVAWIGTRRIGGDVGAAIVAGGARRPSVIRAESSRAGATERQGACPAHGQRMQWRAQSSPEAKLLYQPNSRSCRERMMLPVTGRRVLLVEPAFPIPSKSKNHKNFLPVGLLKIGAWLNSTDNEVRLVRGHPEDAVNRSTLKNWTPDEVWVTSLFTYWSSYVRDAVALYRERYPRAKIVVGGIYASLMPEECKEYTRCDKVVAGVLPQAEKFFPDYSLIAPFNGGTPDYQIVHASRGCPRHCSFCGTWRVEQKFKHVRRLLPSISSGNGEIDYKKLVFYDNNLLAIPNIASLLKELATLRNQKKITWCESQSGFDGRLLLQKPELAAQIRAAGFRNVRVAWDWGIGDARIIEQELLLLENAGYHHKDLYVFMLYNWDINFEEMEKKRIQCWKWGVQIADCRFRPLNQTFDHYNPRKDQTGDDYYIRKQGGWTDALIKEFRRNVRRQNIAVRQGYGYYSHSLERAKGMNPGNAKGVRPEDAWDPGVSHTID